MQKTLIGIDIGTTSVKAVLIGPSGAVIARYGAPYSTQRPGAGLVTQEPVDWLAHVDAALKGFAAHSGRGQVQAIGVTSQVNTHVFANAHFTHLHGAIVWQDQRAVGEAARIEATISLAEKIALLGAPIPVDASHALARMAWMAAHHPRLWEQTAHVMAPKDWVIAILTGQVCADPIASVGLVRPDLTYAMPLIERLPGAAGRLPPLADPLSLAGQMQADPFRGVPVVVGTMDAWASLFGLGVAEAGQGMYLSGTSEVLGLVSPVRVPVPGVISFPEWAGITLHAGPTQAGGASMDWLARLTRQGLGDLLAKAAPIRAETPLFLPHLQGERAPLWDAGARGVFAGLTGATGPADLAAAVMEGVAFSARLAFEAVEASGGGAAREIRLGGGGARSDRWCQIRADAFDRPLLRMRSADAGAVGAAVMAGVGCGAFANIAEAARDLVQSDRVFAPEPAATRLAARRYAQWQDLYRQVSPIHAAMATAGDD